MAMTRSERRNANKKQEKLLIETGTPAVSELIEGVPVIRLRADGELAEYISFRGVLYKTVFTRL